MEFQDELSVAKDAANEAGRIMQEHQENGFDISRKSAYNDIVTDADYACQEHIVKTIHEAFPDDGFLTEEDTELPAGENGRQWIIDPIDGTKNFVHQFPHYCTSIALEVDGTMQVGVVYAPVQDNLFYAVRGDGAYLNGEQIQVSAVDALQDALIITRVTDWNQSELIERETAFLHALLDIPSSFRRPGSAALDLCYVACGYADGHALVTINKWDVAAGQLIVEEAGGVCRHQTAVFDGYIETVASNGRIHTALTQLFDNHIRTD